MSGAISIKHPLASSTTHLRLNDIVNHKHLIEVRKFTKNTAFSQRVRRASSR